MIKDPKQKNIKAKSPLHFARFEFKYILPELKRKAFESEINYFVEHDPFVAGCPEKEYCVRSLYYDDPSYSCFNDKIDGICTRSKFRIRTYANESEKPSPIFLEIKGRHNNLVFKHRTLISQQDGEKFDMSGDQLSEAIIFNAEESHVKEQFKYELINFFASGTQIDISPPGIITL